MEEEETEKEKVAASRDLDSSSCSRCTTRALQCRVRDNAKGNFAHLTKRRLYSFKAKNKNNK